MTRLLLACSGASAEGGDCVVGGMRIGSPVRPPGRRRPAGRGRARRSDFGHDYLLPELDRLADACRLVYYDQRGRGRSYAGDAPDDVTMAGDVDDLDCVRRSLGLETMAVLGHSWGCLVAMEYALGSRSGCRT